MSIRHAADYVVFVFRESLKSFDANRGFQKAAMLAYYSLFSIFPLLLLVLFVLGHVLVSSQTAMNGIERVTNQMFPMFSKVVTREVYALSGQIGWGLVSLVILFWAVTPLAGAIRIAYRDIFKSDKSLSFFKAKILDALAVLGMMVMIMLLVIGEVVYALVKRGLPGGLSFLLRLMDWTVPFAATILFLGFVYLTFAPARLKLRHLLAGCAVTAALLALIGPAFTAVLRFNPNYGYTFGSLKAIFLLLIWVYYSFGAILFGVELTANLHRRDALLVRELLTPAANKDRHLRRLARFVVSYDADQVIFREGEPGDAMFYVVSGAVTLNRKGQTLRVMKPGEYFGEMAMLLKTERTATATVLEPDTRLVTISAANIETVFHDNPKIVLSLLREMAERLRTTNELIASG